MIGVLTDDVSEMPKNWNRRFKYNREKIKTGDVFELAEVVRNLAIREMEKGLSTGEKQMYTRAKKILASEFMYALDKDEEGAEEYLDGLLEERFGASQGDCLTRLATAVIAAAGSGERLGAGGPKAFVDARGQADARVVARGLRRGRARSARSSSPRPPGEEPRRSSGSRSRSASTSARSRAASTARSRSPTRWSRSGPSWSRPRRRPAAGHRGAGRRGRRRGSTRTPTRPA